MIRVMIYVLLIMLTGIVLSIAFDSSRKIYVNLWKSTLKSGYYLRLSAYRTLHPARWYDVFAFVLIAVSAFLQLVCMMFLGQWYSIMKSLAGYIGMRRQKKSDLESAARLAKWKEESRNFKLVKRTPEFEWKTKPVYIKVPMEDLKFHPSEKDVIFYEKGHSDELNNIISSHYAELCSMAQKYGRNLIYLPEYDKSQQGQDFGAEMSYLNPRHAGCVEVPSGFLTYRDIETAYHLGEDISEPCLVRCMDYDEFDETVRFSVRYIESTDYESFLKEFSEYLHSTQCPPTMYRLMSDKEYEEYMSQFTADERFDADMIRIGQEIRSRVLELESRGLSSIIIRKLVGEVPDKPGRLMIDAHFRIFLPDYNNMEIDLSPLQKTVFFLFLRHPEGIYFKNLDDYHKELFDIYSSITGRSDRKAIMQSIDRLTDPYDNSINEKCARIKMAFVSKFNDELARWYYIDGKKGERKRILLPRDLVTWECVIHS